MRLKPAVWLVLAVLSLLGAADPTRFALPPRPPRFKPPVTDVLFADHFSDSLGAWQADMPGVWSVWRGMLRADLPDRKQLRSVLRVGSTDWRDYALDFDVCMMRGVDKGAVVRLDGETGAGVDLRGGTYQDVVAYIREWPIGKSPALNSNGTWNHVRIEVTGDRVVVRVNGELAIDRTTVRIPRKGGIGLAAYTGGVGECTVYYDNVIVTAL